MARLLRVEFPGAIYHVTCRMVGDWRTEQSRLFRDDADRERFIEQLAERVVIQVISARANRWRLSSTGRSWVNCPDHNATVGNDTARYAKGSGLVIRFR